MKTLKLLTLGLLFVLGPAAMASSTATKAVNLIQADDWEKLGSRVVNMKADHDEISVTAMDGVFTRVRLRIMKAPIHLLNINIVFGNGANKNVVFNKRFKMGTWTRVIDLPGNKRIIKKVKLNYKSVPAGKGRAVVSLWGKH